MVTKAAWRAGGLAVGAVLATGALAPARPAAPPPADIHAEFIKYVSGGDSITAYIAYPERRDAAPAVIVIHEIVGMSGFIKQTTERLARQGFVALAPDLLTRRGGTPARQGIPAPGLGVYAENDARITADVPDAAAALKAAGKDYRYTVYPGVG